MEVIIYAIMAVVCLALLAVFLVSAATKIEVNVAIAVIDVLILFGIYEDWRH